jgi:hypothetical protein
MSIRARLTALFIALLLILLVVWLYTSPSHTILHVVISVEGEEAPLEVKRALASLIGEPLMRLSLSKEEAALLKLGTVASVKMRRTLPDTLNVELVLTESSVVVHSWDDGRYYLVKEGALVAIEGEDAERYQRQVMTVEVPASYAQMMVRWGVDELFGQVITLTQSLEGESSLITRVKYDNNSSNSFGKMVLELSSLHAQIWVREPVGAGRVQAAIALVQADQESSLYFLSSETRRYDLYREGLVRR